MRPRRRLALFLALLLVPPAKAQVLTGEQLTELRGRVRRDSCDAALFYYFGRVLAARRQWDAADSAFQQAIAINPQLASAWVAAGVIQNPNSRYWDRLRRAGEAAVEREHGRRDAMVRRGRIIDPFFGLGELPIVGRPESSEGFAILDRWLTGAVQRHGTLDSVPPGLLWVHSRAAVGDFRYAVAIADLRALLRIVAARQLDDSTGVVPVEVTLVRYALAVLHDLAGDRRTATQLYRDVLAEDIGNFMAHVHLARIHEAAGDTAAALRERQAAVDASPEDHTLLLDLGVALQRSGQLARAEEVLRRARELNRRDPQVHYRLGVLLDERGARDSARTVLTTFLQVAPAGWTTPIADARRRLALTP